MAASRVFSRIGAEKREIRSLWFARGRIVAELAVAFGYYSAQRGGAAFTTSWRHVAKERKILENESSPRAQAKERYSSQVIKRS